MMRTSLLALTTASLCWGAYSKPPKPPTCNTTECQQLEKTYSVLRNSTCAKVLTHVPVLPTKDADAFMKAYQNLTLTDGAIGDADEADVLHLADVLLSAADVKKFLTLPDSFEAGGLDSDMVLCAVLVDATPTKMAIFAAQGAAEEALVGSLLKDFVLMRDMLVGGGARNGMWGEAMAIYTQLLKASEVLSTRTAPATPWDDRSQDKAAILHRLALGTAIEQAEPIGHQFKVTPAPWGPGVTPNSNASAVDPVARYLHYEKAFLAGDLDPAFEVLTVFEMRHTTDSVGSDDDLSWMRYTMANYRPEFIAMSYHWRFAESVHGDVAYGHPACDDLPGICTGRFAQITAAGGECGPRAFWGRIAKKAWGIPTWGVTQPGHAAMSTWTPDGWGVLLGAAWSFSWWAHRGGDRGGMDYVLETQCRELRPVYQQVLRGGWAAQARYEAPVGHAWKTNPGSGKGGLWSALSLYHQRLAVTDATKNGTKIPTRPIGPSVVPTKVDALIAKWPAVYPRPNITYGTDGTITIPAAAFSFTNKSAKLKVYKSFFDDGEQVSSPEGSLLNPAATGFGYEVTVSAAGTYYLTANHSTWHVNPDLKVSLGAHNVSVPVYYTVGYWNETQPVELKLAKGTNVLTFTRSSTRGLVFKAFKLYTKKPVIPAPPPAYVPQPTPAPDQYIKVPPTTTCTKQGIGEVPAKFCADACNILGLKFTGSKSRQNLTGCFVMAAGPWTGDCTYNENKAATDCPTPPCDVLGYEAQQLCMRV